MVTTTLQQTSPNSTIDVSTAVASTSLSYIDSTQYPTTSSAISTSRRAVAITATVCVIAALLLVFETPMY